MTHHPLLVAILAVLLVILMVGGGPFAGWYITRRNRLQNIAQVAGGTPWIETRELPRIRAGSAPYLRPVPSLTKRSAADRYAQALVPAPFIGRAERTIDVPRMFEETRELVPAPSRRETPAWAGEATQGWSIVEAEVYTSELAEIVGETGLTDAEQSWLADPLGSVCLPPEPLEQHDIPMAQQAFDALVEQEELTGEGADLDIEWAAWNLYDKQESYA